ncbi:MAG TPA: universal stress protein [Oligoflexus sp.]|uniref:universal stress protein n=1 Tax=Oligoflexus sp. TaxID=1971216 RepID=UPI002D7EEDDA|nr:universal stress protein [Oligoflexus sp.]HET9241704.1 universal stress protein [Oligoflexus sp.]
MKIVVGVDNLPQGDLVLKVIRDLDFPQPQLKLVNIVEVWIEQGSMQYGFGATPYNLEGYFRAVEDEARSALKFLKENAERQGMKDCETQLLYGNISNQLMDYADAAKTDLLAIGSFGKGPWEGILIGSVGRKAVINSKHSVLIAKDSYRDGSDLSVVLATDHSPYADRWLEKFVAWAPRGIKHLTLLSVLPDVMFQTDIGTWIREGLNTANDKAAQKLQGLSPDIKTRVEVGPVSETIARVMQETQSELLILGSQGHGFMERVALGSTSLEQAIKQPYSVLVVRA